MTVYPPNDDIVGPVAAALLTIGQQSFTGIESFFADETDEPPPHNSLMVMNPTFDIRDDSNGRFFLMLKYRLCLRYDVRESTVDLPALRQYVTPFLLAYGAWENNELGGLARVTSVTSGGIVREMYSGAMYRTLLLNIVVETEYNIPTD